MFDRISPVYDLMNRVMTAGLDGRWRRLTAEAVVRPGDRVLDAACGTDDLALAARAEGGDVTGLDFSDEMLAGAPEVERDPVDARRPDRAPLRGRELRRRHGQVRGPERARAGTASARLLRVLRPRWAARLPRDHPAPRRPATVLRPLVRSRRAAARPRPAGRGGLHVPSRERAPLSRTPKPAPRWSVPASPTSPGGSWPAASSRSMCHEGPRERARGSPRLAGARHLPRRARAQARTGGSVASRARVAGGDGDSRRGRKASSDRFSSSWRRRRISATTSVRSQPGSRSGNRAHGDARPSDLLDAAVLRRGHPTAWATPARRPRTGERRLSLRPRVLGLARVGDAAAVATLMSAAPRARAGEALGAARPPARHVRRGLPPPLLLKTGKLFEAGLGSAGAGSTWAPSDWRWGSVPDRRRHPRLRRNDAQPARRQESTSATGPYAAAYPRRARGRRRRSGAHG